MSAITKIQWTDRTWNPVRGCSSCSPGCDHCYAMGQAHRFAGPGKPYEGLTTIRRGKVDWSGVARIAAVFGVMGLRRHTFQVLTKRPARALEWFRWVSEQKNPRYLGADRLPGTYVLWEAERALSPLNGEPVDDMTRTNSIWAEGVATGWQWPLPNVWLGVSVESQATADERIPLLLQTPAAVHFISAGPLLGPIDIRGGLHDSNCLEFRETFTDPHSWRCICSEPREAHLSWVICGGESGPGARPCALEWRESIVAQCREASTPCFVKQLGACVVSEHRACESEEEDKRQGFRSRWLWRAGLQDKKGGDPAEWPDELQVRQFPKAVS